MSDIDYTDLMVHIIDTRTSSHDVDDCFVVIKELMLELLEKTGTSQYIEDFKNNPVKYLSHPDKYVKDCATKAIKELDKY
jgi:hypothetical protein